MASRPGAGIVSLPYRDTGYTFYSTIFSTIFSALILRDVHSLYLEDDRQQLRQ